MYVAMVQSVCLYSVWPRAALVYFSTMTMTHVHTLIDPRHVNFEFTVQLMSTLIILSSELSRKHCGETGIPYKGI